MLPYFYSLFYDAHTKGDMVIKSLWVNFPSDATAVSIDRQFMVGSAVLISPVLDQGATSVNAYFPPALWYSFADRRLSVDSTAGGVWKILSAPLTTINVHVKGGSILPLQQTAMTTTAGRQTPFTFFVALCAKGGAEGSLFWDDGEQVELQNYLHASYKASASASAGSFVASIDHNNYSSANLPIQDIVVVGRDLQSPSAATLNGVPLTATQFSFDSFSGALTFKNLNVKINDEINLQWK